MQTIKQKKDLKKGLIMQDQKDRKYSQEVYDYYLGINDDEKLSNKREGFLFLIMIIALIIAIIL